MKYETSIDIAIEIPDDEIIEYCSERLYPAHVFSREELEEWAKDNGYVKKEQEAEG